MIDPSVLRNYSEFMKRKWRDEMKVYADSHERLILASLGDFLAKLIKSTAVRFWDDPNWLPGTPRTESLVVALQSLRAPSSSPYARAFRSLAIAIGREYAMPLNRAELFSILSFVEARNVACHSGMIGLHDVAKLQQVIGDAIKLCRDRWPNNIEVHRKAVSPVLLKYKSIIDAALATPTISVFHSTKGYQGNIGEIARELRAARVGF